MFSKELLKNIEIIYQSPNFNNDIEVNHLTDDTRDLQIDSCFVCIEGKEYDGHKMIEDNAITPRLIIASKQLNTDVPYVLVPNTKAALPLISLNFFNNPSENLQLIGVTGTDGKTTTAFIVKQIIDACSSCAYIGTNGFIYDQRVKETCLTTPKPIELNRFLHELTNQSIKYASLEVSSQGIDTHRIDGLSFKIAIFTNLTHEHLDYHQTMEKYFESKLKLFQSLHEDSFAIINKDSPYAQKIIDATKAKIITYGTSIDADIRITKIETQFHATRFDLMIHDQIVRDITLNLFGDYNVYNATAALCAGLALQMNLQKMIATLGHLLEVDGRMHVVDSKQPYQVIVDFAHTPNGLNCLLRNLNKFKSKNMIVVFGAAGKRDASKRPLMGAVVEQFASHIILTNEDPKTEEPLTIILDIFKGIQDPFKVNIILDRKKAIIHALKMARPDDLVVITGKGNEHTQILNGYRIEHNDIAIVEEYLGGQQ